MVNVSFMQSNFQGGEVSSAYQARMDEKEYLLSTATCLNYIPSQEGSLLPRGGFRRIGNTKNNAWANVLPFRFAAYDGYVAEHTSDNLRLWSNGHPVFDLSVASLVSVSGTPPTFVVQDTSFVGSGFVPTTWNTDDSIIVIAANTGGAENGTVLLNREFLLTVVDQAAGQITLTDAETGASLGALSSLSSGDLLFYRILDLTTYYTYPEGVRKVQFSKQDIFRDDLGNILTVGPPDERVTFLYPLASPKSLSRRQAYIDEGTTTHNFELLKEKFIDGPYLDPLDIPMTVSGTTGDVTVQLRGYSASIRYASGDFVWYSNQFYISLVDDNKGNTPPTSGAKVSAYWAVVRTWDISTTFALGNVVAAPPTTEYGVDTVYYSLQNSNTNHTPATSGTWWSTTAPTWDSGTTYAVGACVTSGGSVWMAVTSPSVGVAPANPVWIVVDFSTTFNSVTDNQTGIAGQSYFFNSDAGDVTRDNLPRLIRLKSSPEPWSPKFSYSSGDLVNYNDDIFKSLVGSNSGNPPGQDFSKWELQPQTILWTWGEIKSVTDAYTAVVTLKGQDLPDTNPIFSWRLGVFSDVTGWPTCGVYHEGRLWLAGPNGNRIDGSRSNEGYNFAPTAPDGTVADDNGISYTLNSSETETIQALASTSEGIVVMTSEAEWLLSASNLNDPITPTSIQVHRTTSYSAAAVEIVRLPSALLTVQNGGRRLLEYRNFIDMTSYQSRLNALDLTRRCQHLTLGGVGDTQYQSLPQPIIWAVAAGSIGLTTTLTQGGESPPNVDVSLIPFGKIPNGRLFGMGYARTPDLSYNAPFSFEHGMEYASGTLCYQSAIAVQRGADITAEYLYAPFLDKNGKWRMEMLMPPHQAPATADTYNNDGTVNTFGTLTAVCMVDSAVQPSGCKIASDGLSATFYGLWPLAGETVQFVCRGKYVGDYTVGADGSVSVAFNTAFAKTDIGRAMRVTVPNAMYQPVTYQNFQLDTNSITGVLEPGGNSQGFYGYFGYKYRRRGQLLRPPVNGANGPSFGKTRRNHRMAVYTDNAQEISIGSSFSKLRALKLELTGSVAALGPADFATGIFRDTVDNDYGFDGNLAWEQTSPVPGAILAVGGFLEVVDV